MPSVPTRRQFLETAALAAGITIVPRHVLGGPGYQAPSDTFNVAAVGVGGMGRSNLQALSSQNIVALCDVDWGYVDERFKDLETQLPGAKKTLADLKANPNAPATAGPARNLSPEVRMRNAEQRVANIEGFLAAIAARWRASCTDQHIGFCTYTCLPAAIAADAIGACM